MKPLLSIAIVLFSTALGFAQGKIIDKSEFDAAVKGSAHPISAWKGKDYRQTITTTSTVPGRPETGYSSKFIREQSASGSLRMSRESRFGPQPAKSSEEIRIGTDIYTRTGTEGWTKKTTVENSNPPDPPRPAERKVEELSRDSEYRFLGEEVYKNRNVNVYQAAEKIKGVMKSTGKEYTSEIVRKYYVADGLILRDDFRSTSGMGELNNTNVITIEWELDPTIKIIAPEMKP